MSLASVVMLSTPAAALSQGRSRCSEDGHGHFVVAMKLIAKDDEPATAAAAKIIKTTVGWVPRKRTGKQINLACSDGSYELRVRA